MTNLKYLIDSNPTIHPQAAMKELGITYRSATPQTVADQWWFWDCENVPEDLPPFLKVLNADPAEWAQSTRTMKDQELKVVGDDKHVEIHVKEKNVETVKKIISGELKPFYRIDADGRLVATVRPVDVKVSGLKTNWTAEYFNRPEEPRCSTRGTHTGEHCPEEPTHNIDGVLLCDKCRATALRMGLID